MPRQRSRPRTGSTTSVAAAATTVGQVTTIITGAVKDVAGSLGGFATELFEIRESAKKALDDDT